MPWKDGTKTEERLRFVARRLESDSMSDLCREFGISRKTGLKIFIRCKEERVVSRCDRSRRPVRCANQLKGQVEQAIIRAKQDKPSWGARKIRALLAGDGVLVAAILDRLLHHSHVLNIDRLHGLEETLNPRN
jgi:transposase-like protein